MQNAKNLDSFAVQRFGCHKWKSPHPGHLPDGQNGFLSTMHLSNLRFSILKAPTFYKPWKPEYSMLMAEENLVHDMIGPTCRYPKTGTNALTQHIRDYSFNKGLLDMRWIFKL